MFSATFIVKSISTLSILGKALNHTPARMALNFSFTNWVRFRKIDELFCNSILSHQYFKFDRIIMDIINPKKICGI